MSGILKMATRGGVLLLGFLVGCQVQQQAKEDAPITVQSGSRGAESATAVRMQVVLRGADGAASRALAHRAELAAGAHVGLRLEAEGAGVLWLYSYHRASDGKLEPLAPEPARVSPGVVHELPAGGLWYQLVAPVSALEPKTTLKENFYVIASREPLGARLSDAVAKLPDDREPPPLSNTATRFPGPVYRRVLDENGTAILAVSLLQTAPSR